MEQLLAQLFGGGGGGGGAALRYLPVVSVPNHYAPLLFETFGGRWVGSGMGRLAWALLQGCMDMIAAAPLSECVLPPACCRPPAAAAARTTLKSRRRAG